jgi:hypothetical protein
MRVTLAGLSLLLAVSTAALAQFDPGNLGHA